VRFLPLALLALLGAVACSDDDDPQAAAVTTTSTTTSTTADACPDGEPDPPAAADGSPAEIVATAGDLQFAVVDHGASVDVVSLYLTVDCALEPVSLGGSVAALAVGGSVTQGDGIRCANGDVTVLSATSDDGATYQATTTTYRVDGSELIEVDTAATTIEAQTDSEALAAYYRLDC
jgi:hypothetical protein